MDPWSTALIEALDKVRPAVVHIDARTPKTNQLAVGTGLVFDHYHIIASAQAVAMDDEIIIKLRDGKRRRATCVGIDPLYFLAILRAHERLNIDLPTIAPDHTVPPGLFVFSVGYALGEEHTVANGVISSSDRTVYRPSSNVRRNGNFPVDGLITTTAAIHPGNMGGPLVDLDGRVVGINGLAWQGGMYLAVQASVAVRIASQIIDHGYAVHPYLGFSGDPDVIDHMWVDLFSLPTDRGVVVSYVAPGGPGEKAGLQEMDMVMAVDSRQPVLNTGYIRKVLASKRHGEKVQLTVLRQGEIIEIKIPVEEMPNLSDPVELDEDGGS